MSKSPNGIWQRMLDAAQSDPRRLFVIEAPAGEPKTTASEPEAPPAARTLH